MKSLVDRLRDRCRLEPATGCWVWQQGTNGEQYPQVSITAISSRPINVRRLVYTIAVGQIPRGRVVSSTCSDSMCINPAHLRCVRREAVAIKTINMVNKMLTPEARRAARKQDVGTWHPPPPPPSRVNGSAPGGSSKKPRKPASPVTSVYVAGLLTAAAIGTARKSQTGNGGSFGPTSAQGQGE